ncbi:cutinase family protein [Streptomyces sioyaensis]|uniref:cutinase family protein n=1 Tax=Streptomyces sioyaensis TaxID=67364 RepID=UPI0037D4E0D8
MPARPPSVPPSPGLPLTPTRPSGGTTHTVVPGDTLWDIARKFLGSGPKWSSIYATNKSAIEKTAQGHGLASSDRGHWIFPRLRLQIPLLPGESVLHVVPSQTIPPCTHGTFVVGLRGTLQSSGTNTQGDAALGDAVGAVVNKLRQGNKEIHPYGVPYPASFVNPRYDTSVADGIEMTKAVLVEHAECSDEKIVVVGYSQGAEVIRKALGELPPDVRARISGIALFGDPVALGGPSADSFGIPATSYCDPRDPVCTTGSRDRALECVTLRPTCPHFNYPGGAADLAAAFLDRQPRR